MIYIAVREKDIKARYGDKDIFIVKCQKSCMWMKLLRRQIMFWSSLRLKALDWDN